MTPVLYHIITAEPALAEKYPHLTLAKNPSNDVVLFCSGVSGQPVDNPLLPSGALHPAILAGCIIAFNGPAAVVHYDVADTRENMGLPRQSPFTRGTDEWLEHRQVQLHIANKMLANFNSNPQSKHYIFESVPTGTMSAEVRLIRSGIKRAGVGYGFSSLYQGDLDRLNERKAVVEMLANDRTFEDMDDYAAIVNDFDEKMTAGSQGSASIGLSGGVMAWSVLSERVMRRGIPRRMKGSYSLYTNPILLKRGVPFELDYGLQRSLITHPETAVDKLQGLLSKLIATDFYNHGHVNEGIGIGAAFNYLALYLEQAQDSSFEQSIIQYLSRYTTELTAAGMGAYKQ